MSDKKSKKSPEAEKRNLLLQHPEIKNNARALFRNENGKTIVEEIVPRGDVKTKDAIYPRNQSDLKEEDLRNLAVCASELIDPVIFKYDPRLAKEDALVMAIRTKDGGKYEGKINASTFCLILDTMGTKKKASEEDKPAVVETQVGTGLEKIVEKNAHENNVSTSDIPVEENLMDKVALLKVKEDLLAKVAAIDVLVGVGAPETSKEAAETKPCPKCGTNVLVKTKYCVKCKAKTLGGDSSKKEEKKEPKKEKEASSEIAGITAAIDKVAGELEAMNDPELFKIAFQLDQMADVLEGKKEARTIETDPPASYMKDHFKAGLKEGDADEKSYMKSFDTDVSEEVAGVKDKKDGNAKSASSKLPYQIIK